MRKLIWVVLAAGVLGAILAADNLLDSDPNSVKHELGFEIAKFLIQLVLVVLFGGAIMQEYNARRDRKAARNEFRKGFLRRLVQVYLKTKHARLLLRAKLEGSLDAGRDGRLLPWDPYEKQMSCIGDSMTELEMLKRELEFFPKVFDEKHREPLKAHLDALEEYLKALLKEYRDKAGTARDARGRIQVGQLPALGAFATSSRQGSTFRPAFAERMYSAARLIQEERLIV